MVFKEGATLPSEDAISYFEGTNSLWLDSLIIIVSASLDVEQLTRDPSLFKEPGILDS